MGDNKKWMWDPSKGKGSAIAEVMLTGDHSVWVFILGRNYEASKKLITT